MPPRALVLYCVDVDCCAPWLIQSDPANSTDVSSISRGLFGANVGLDRLLALFEKHHVKATMNIPSHTLESFPEQMAKVRDAGHEIGLHGYMHEPPNMLTEQQERDVLVKSIEVYKKFTGHVPKGYIAPSWDASPRTIRLLEEHGIEYDHSLFSHDSQPHWAMDIGSPSSTTYADFSKPASTWMKPMGKMTSRNVVEIPGNWDCTDFAAFNFVPAAPNSHGYVSPHVIEKNWMEMFTWLYEDAKSKGDGSSFLFPLTIHPQSSGKPHVLAMHERFIPWLKKHEGVEFVTCGKVNDEVRSGKIGVVEVTGGV